MPWLLVPIFPPPPAILVLIHVPLAWLACMLMDIWPKIAGDLRNFATCWRGGRG